MNQMTIYTNIGIGTDIEEVDRFRKLDKKKDKIFTLQKIDFIITSR